MKNNMHLIVKLFKELKNGIDISVGQGVFKLWTKTVKNGFWINSSTAWPNNIVTLFLSSLDSLLRCIYFLSQGCDNFEIEHKACYLRVEGAIPP